MKSRNEKGFSLVELLVVVIIIAIVAAIAIPNLLASRKAANEASAVSTLRTIHSAQSTYQAGNATNVYGTGAQLLAAGLVDSVIGAAAFTKSGYDFTIATQDAAANYCGTAAPDTTSTGTRYFGGSSDGVIKTDTVAVTCAAGTATGNPI